MIPTIAMSDFARKQHQPMSGNSYMKRLSEPDLILFVGEVWENRRPGRGETTLDRKVIVTLPSEAVSYFRIPYVDLDPRLKIQARVTQRQAGEDFYIETYVDPDDSEYLGIKPKTAKKVEIVCYSIEALLENGGTRSSDADWEIVAILATETEQEEPMTPLTMARNYLELPGGTKSDYTAQEFAEAIMYWSGRKGVKIKKVTE